MGQFDTVRIGVCDVYWIPDYVLDSIDQDDPQQIADAEVFLGLTKGGVTLNYEPNFYDITVDQYGETPVDSVLIGESVTVTVPIAETDLKKLKMLSPTGTIVGDPDDIGNSKLTFGSKPGLRLGDHVGRLRLHPIVYDDNREDVVIYRAANRAPLELNYRVNEERIYNVEFHGLIDKTRTNGDMLWQIGNPEATNDSGNEYGS